MKHRAIFDIEINSNEYLNQFKYQQEQTDKLDQMVGDFDQAIINEIVLWKVNRYAKLKDETLRLLNTIDRHVQSIDRDLTRQVLENLLDETGFGLPMASTVLRFKNPNIYQIIDQRVYRVISQEELKMPNKIEDQISLYFDYLERLRKICESKSIFFAASDRILYELDKVLNKDIKLKNYG